MSDTHRTIINVSNRLPVTIGKTLRKSSGGLVAALEGGATEGMDLKWIGWPGAAVTESGRRAQLESELREQHGYLPVFLSGDDIQGYYHGFSNSSLWPLLHYLPSFMRYDRAWWNAYSHVNELFARAVLDIADDIADDDALVWIHDYHLMLLPSILRARRPSLRIGFFLHTPFPSYEVFRCHPRRQDLLRGLLGADLIGFHTFGYLRHFRSSVLRILGLDSEITHIPHSGRDTAIGVYPIGINAASFREELASERFRRKRDALREAYGGRRIVLSVERLDYTKGITRRLEAIDTFLSDEPDRDRVCFVFISVPSRGEVKEYQRLRAEVEGLVGQINGRHSTVGNTPVHFMFRSIAFTELCALYSLADVALVTPLIDGMNLVAKEYVACQGEDSGALVLSEFAGAAEELFNALTVNPYDIQGVAGRIRQALRLSPSERRRRMGQMRERVLRYDARYWASSFIRDLAACEPAEAGPVEGEAVVSEILTRYHTSENRAFFLDYDGTLREFEDDPAAAAPTDEIRDLLRRLEEIDGLEVFLISGRNRADLENWFGGCGLTLIAEHGSCRRAKGDDEWHDFDPGAGLSCRDQVLQVFRHYVGSTPGSWVEEKPSAVVWHYRRSDPEFGRWKASLLMGELYEVLSNLPVEIHHGKGIVEVNSVYINKRKAVEHFIKERSYDLVLCAGDDQTDENMFDLARDGVLTLKIGPGDTTARYRVSGPAAFRDLLARIIAAATQDAGAPA